MSATATRTVVSLTSLLLAGGAFLGAWHLTGREAAGQGAPGCVVMNAERLPLAQRRSPLDSVVFTVRGDPVKVCYGRPSSRGRTMIGGEAVPFGAVWRTGANEPTMIHTTAPIAIAGVRVEPGTYSLYTVPGAERWEIIVNRATSQWGHERNYTAEVEAREVGRATVDHIGGANHVETFTIVAMPGGQGDAVLLLAWERSRVEVPITGPGG